MSFALHGLAVQFGVDAKIDDFFEIIRRSAFSESLKTGKVSVNINHDRSRHIAEWPNDSHVRMIQRDEALYLRLDWLPDSDCSREIIAANERRQLTGCSIGFKPLEVTWREVYRDGKQVRLRTVHRAILDHIAILIYPSRPAHRSTEAMLMKSDAIRFDPVWQSPEMESERAEQPKFSSGSMQSMGMRLRLAETSLK